MTGSNQTIPNPLAQPANRQRVLSDGASGDISFGPEPKCSSNAGDGEDICPLWNGRIIDASFPQCEHGPIGPASVR
jgi:hypothetical protein